MLLAAKTSWASTPNRQGAEYALEYIRQIDPSSKAFPAAQELIKEIKDKNIADLDFEYHYKYETELALQNSALEVARSIGVAYGKGQNRYKHIRVHKRLFNQLNINRMKSYFFLCA